MCQLRPTLLRKRTLGQHIQQSLEWCARILMRMALSKFIGPNNGSRSTLWVLETCLILGLRPFMIILISASLSSETYRDARMPEMSAFGVAKSTSPKKPWCQTCLLVLRCFGRCCGSLRAIGSDTSLTVSHELKAEIPSIRRPSSNKLISSSVLPCETAVSFFYDHK